MHILSFVVVFMFNVFPTAKVIWRRGHRLVSSDRLVKPGIEPATPGLQGKRFIHYTTAAPHTFICNWQQPSLNQQKGGEIMALEIGLWLISSKLWAGAGIKLVTPGSEVILAGYRSNPPLLPSFVCVCTTVLCVCKEQWLWKYGTAV